MPSDLNKGRKDPYLNIKVLTVEVGKEGEHQICHKMTMENDIFDDCTTKYRAMNQKKKMLERLFPGHPVQFDCTVDCTLDSNGYQS